MSRRDVGRGSSSAGCNRWSRVCLSLVVASFLVLAFATPTAVAAAETTVTIVPGASPVAVGETVTVDLVVAAADGGVGGFVAEVQLGNPNVATVTAVTFAGEPPLSDVVIASEGEAARFGAVLMNTSETGAVTIASVTVRADETGSTSLGLTIDPLADEQGEPYTVETANTELHLVGGGDAVPPPDDPGSPDFGDGLDLGGFGDESETPTAIPDPVRTEPSDSTQTAVSTSGAILTPTATADDDTPSTTGTADQPRSLDPAPTDRVGPTTQSSPTIPPGGQLGLGLLISALFAALVGLRLRD